jgi:hypothetical protein
MTDDSYGFRRPTRYLLRDENITPVQLFATSLGRDRSVTHEDRVGAGDRRPGESIFEDGFTGCEMLAATSLRHMVSYLSLDLFENVWSATRSSRRLKNTVASLWRNG